MNGRSGSRWLWRWRWPLLCLALLGALVLAGSLAWRYYLQAHEVRLDPLALESQPLGDPSSSRPDVLLVGDSRVADWPELDCPDGLSSLNDGVSGHTSAQTLARLRERLEVTKPRVVVVETCINDLKTIPFWLERRESIVAACMRNVAAMVQVAQNAGAKLVLLTVIPMGPSSPPQRVMITGADDPRQAVREVNAAIRSLATDDVVILPADELLGINGLQLSAAYARDRLHINAAGYAVLGPTLCRVLAQLLPAD